MPEKIRITFLGTSGPVPSPARNHTSILLNYKSENILFDCGEGTQIQFKKVQISPIKITKLLISHWHGDHVLGIPGLLQTLSFNKYNKTLEVYGPHGIEEHFKDVLKAFPSVNFGNFKIKISEAKSKFIDEKDFSVSAFPLSHGIHCNGYCFTEKDKIRIDKQKLAKLKIPNTSLLAKLQQGKDISYNGKKFRAKDLTYKEAGRKICVVMDGIYDPKTAEYVKNADMLIIESAYSDELKDLAREHQHRTAKQAAEIAKKARVKQLILTHLSERYDKDKGKILNEAKKIFKNSVIAEDLKSFEVE
jgi:ribonuclease Z